MIFTMKRTPIEQLTNYELNKQKRQFEVLTFGAAIFLLFLAGIIIHEVFLEGQYYMALLLIGCIGSPIPGFIALREFNQEINRREKENPSLK